MTTEIENLRQRLNDCPLTITEIAKRADINKGTVSLFMSGKTPSPRADVFFRLQSVMNKLDSEGEPA